MRSRKAQGAIVQQILASSGYSLLPSPLIVGGTRFSELTCMARPSGNDLVILLSGTGRREMGWVREVAGVARTLDAIGSTRSLTTICLSASVDAINEMREVSRVLALDSEDFDQVAVLERKLSILSPLSLPQTFAGAYLSAQVDEVIAQSLADRRMEPVRRAAVRGREAVERSMIDVIQRAWRQR